MNHHRQQGLFIGAFPTYGYFKDPDDYHRLIIDDTAAEIVRMIFSKYLDGRSILGITKDLNAMGVPNPTKYKQSLGWNFRTKSDNNDGLWCDRTVRRILQNEIYIGNMVQGKNRTISYKVHVCRSVPKEEWYIVENTHEPIIDRKTFETAQMMLNRTSRSLPFMGCVDIFSGLLFCADCGKPMCKKTNRMSYGVYEYYRCSTKSKRGGCSNHTIRRDKLYEAILAYLQMMVNIYLDNDTLIENCQRFKKRNESSYQSVIQERIAERQRYENAIIELYPDWKNGDITREEYTDLKRAIEARIVNINAMIDDLKQRNESLKQLPEGIRNDKKIQQHSIPCLSRFLLIALIDRICINENNNISIKTKFHDEFRTQ